MNKRARKDHEMKATTITDVVSNEVAGKLLVWMKSVKHVEINQAKDLITQGRLTQLHVDYFHNATCGLGFNEYKKLRGVK